MTTPVSVPQPEPPSHRPTTKQRRKSSRTRRRKSKPDNAEVVATRSQESSSIPTSKSSLSAAWSNHNDDNDDGLLLLSVPESSSFVEAQDIEGESEEPPTLIMKLLAGWQPSAAFCWSDATTLKQENSDDNKNKPSLLMACHDHPSLTAGGFSPFALFTGMSGEVDLLSQVEPLLCDIAREEGKLRTLALQKLYRLTDREHKHNR